MMRVSSSRAEERKILFLDGGIVEARAHALEQGSGGALLECSEDIHRLLANGRGVRPACSSKVGAAMGVRGRSGVAGAVSSGVVSARGGWTGLRSGSGRGSGQPSLGSGEPFREFHWTTTLRCSFFFALARHAGSNRSTSCRSPLTAGSLRPSWSTGMPRFVENATALDRGNADINGRTYGRLDVLDAEAGLRVCQLSTT